MGFPTYLYRLLFCILPCLCLCRRLRLLFLYLELGDQPPSLEHQPNSVCILFLNVQYFFMCSFVRSVQYVIIVPRVELPCLDWCSTPRSRLHCGHINLPCSVLLRFVTIECIALQYLALHCHAVTFLTDLEHCGSYFISTAKRCSSSQSVPGSHPIPSHPIPHIALVVLICSKL